MMIELVTILASGEIDLIKADRISSSDIEPVGSSILTRKDYVDEAITEIYSTNSSLGNTLSKAEILSVLVENSIPNFVTNKKFYILENNNRIFHVYYKLSSDSYHYERLSKAN